jgi:hypothetical protein
MRAFLKTIGFLSVLLAFVTAVIVLITEGLKFYRELPTPTPAAAGASSTPQPQPDQTTATLQEVIQQSTPTSQLPTSNPPTATQSPVLIHNELVSPETLARIVGGDAAYWKQAGPVVWVYSNKDHNTLMQHPGDNMILTYWAGFGDPQNADGCQLIISPANSLEKYVKCPSGTNAQIVADQVGLHLIDYTGYFP